MKEHDWSWKGGGKVAEPTAASSAFVTAELFAAGYGITASGLTGVHVAFGGGSERFNASFAIDLAKVHL